MLLRVKVMLSPIQRHKFISQTPSVMVLPLRLRTVHSTVQITCGFSMILTTLALLLRSKAQRIPIKTQEPILFSLY